ncbi:MAG: UDP-N-acetylmuramate dehydrogenase [Alphaproteobacteria bacterium]|nr:UDP-N-acetylmuramate dehydrogenase [Alphaproteobacteria bacterium]
MKKENYSLKNLTWLKLGGPADLFFEPTSVEALQSFIQQNDQKDYSILGAGSNTLVRDKGIRGAVLHLGSFFSEEKVKDNFLTFGAGCASRKVALTAQKNNLSGLEFLYTIPGTLGGAVRMNAGCYGGEIADCIESVKILTKEAEFKTLSKEECEFSYRHSNFPQGSIVLEATFKCQVCDGEKLLEKMKKTQEKRNASQPFGQSTAGSTFKNPEGHVAGRLIDEAGLKGTKIGGVFVSEKHANFFINDGTGTAQDFEDLVAFVQKKVFEKFHIHLEPEVRFVGEK